MVLHWNLVFAESLRQLEDSSAMRVVKEAKAQARNEIQLASLFVFASAPLVQLTDLGQNINKNFDSTTNILLSILLSVSASVCLWGCFDKDIKPGFWAELGGWIGICISFLTYLSAEIWSNPNWYTAVSTYFFVGFSLGAVLRGLKIVRALKMLSLVVKLVE